MKKILLSFIILSCLINTGCLPVVFIAGATTGGVIISDQRNIQTMMKDKEITCRALIQ